MTTKAPPARLTTAQLIGFFVVAFLVAICLLALALIPAAPPEPGFEPTTPVQVT